MPTRHLLRRLCRSVAGIVVVLLLLTEVVAGSYGPDAQFCVCTAGVTVERDGSCCADGDGQDPVPAPSDCTACHLIPLPDSPAVPSLVPAVPEAVCTLAVRIPVAVIVWPALAGHPCGGHPPPQRHLHLVRSVVITC